MLGHLYTKLHRAIVELWSTGVVHGNLHDENVIDFGFAVMLPPEYRQKIAPFLARGDIEGAWQVIGTYVDAVQLKRNNTISWYNPNAKALRVWHARQHTSPSSPRSIVPRHSGISTSTHHGLRRSLRLQQQKQKKTT